MRGSLGPYQVPQAPVLSTDGLFLRNRNDGLLHILSI